MLGTLGNIRLATLIEMSKTKSEVKTIYKLEEFSDIKNRLIQALEIKDLHDNRPKINGVSIYN